VTALRKGSPSHRRRRQQNGDLTASVHRNYRLGERVLRTYRGHGLQEIRGAAAQEGGEGKQKTGAKGEDKGEWTGGRDFVEKRQVKASDTSD